MFKPITPGYLDSLETVLKKAAGVHRQVKLTIDFSKKDKPHAFYLIQGGCITNAFISIELARRGYQNLVFQLTRFIRESMALMEYFETLPENSPILRDWFEDKIISAPMAPKYPPKKPDPKIEERLKRKAELSGQSLETVRRVEQVTRMLYDEFSKSQHVTLKAVKYNVYRDTHEFDYLSKALQYRGYENFTLGEFIVIPTIQCLILFPEVTPVSLESRKLLRKLIDDVHNRDMSL